MARLGRDQPEQSRHRPRWRRVPALCAAAPRPVPRDCDGACSLTSAAYRAVWPCRVHRASGMCAAMRLETSSASSRYLPSPHCHHRSVLIGCEERGPKSAVSQGTPARCELVSLRGGARQVRIGGGGRQRAQPEFAVPGLVGRALGACCRLSGRQEVKERRRELSGGFLGDVVAGVNGCPLHLPGPAVPDGGGVAVELLHVVTGRP